MCFKRNNNTEYCIKGYDTEAYETNKTVLEDAFKDVENACSFDVDYSGCDAVGLLADASSYGDVGARVGGVYCGVASVGHFECYEY